ncbi:PadR family transcriptional regulator [Halobacteriales archaeon SW_7_68_16]|nr:MAG: PadR family transcriptional regulator [Halobacteriales archaeon SW_7_68_16]
MAEAVDPSSDPDVPRDLTAFQYDVLTILAEEPLYGLAVKERLESHYGHEVNHGRLYPNLDDLFELGLVEKRERDGRTNEYALTDAGLDALVDRLRWTTDSIAAGDRDLPLDHDE